MATLEGRLEALEKELCRPKPLRVCLLKFDHRPGDLEIDLGVAEFTRIEGQPPDAVVNVVFVESDGNGRLAPTERAEHSEIAGAATAAARKRSADP